VPCHYRENRIIPPGSSNIQWDDTGNEFSSGNPGGPTRPGISTGTRESRGGSKPGKIDKDLRKDTQGPPLNDKLLREAILGCYTNKYSAGGKMDNISRCMDDVYNIMDIPLDTIVSDLETYSKNPLGDIGDNFDLTEVIPNVLATQRGFGSNKLFIEEVGLISDYYPNFEVAYLEALKVKYPDDLKEANQKFNYGYDQEREEGLWELIREIIDKFIVLGTK
jgi:hypothetical protein